MIEWKEVSAYTGEEIEEDAPVNSVAGGGVSMPSDAVYAKKKKKEVEEENIEVQEIKTIKVPLSAFKFSNLSNLLFFGSIRLNSGAINPKGISFVGVIDISLFYLSIYYTIAYLSLNYSILKVLIDKINT